MKLTYAGKNKEFTPEEQVKLDKRLVRLGKLVERKGERAAHVAIKSTRHLHRAEVAMQFEAMPVVGIASATDVYQAVSAAVDKLEKQIVKLHEKHREAIRIPQGKAAKNGSAKPPRSAKANGVKQKDDIAVVVAEANGKTAKSAKVYRVSGHRIMKPMTIEEAVMEIGSDQDYLPFPDADTGYLSVLIRRADGHFDLLEC